MAFYVYAVYWQRSARSAFLLARIQKIQLTWLPYDGNEMRNTTCAETETLKVPTRVNQLLLPILWYEAGKQLSCTQKTRGHSGRTGVQLIA